MKQFLIITGNKCTLFLTSRSWNLSLFIVLIALMVPRSILPEYQSLLAGALKVTFWIIGLDLLLCTICNYKALAKPVLVIHIGFLTTLAASQINLLGFVATINIHEGQSSDTAFRWDKETDHPLGFTLLVKRIEREWYPTDVKIGVLKNGIKTGLYETRTGETIVIDGYRVRASQLIPETKDLLLTILDNADHQLGEYATSKDGGNLPPSFPLSFKLVAYKNPELKRIWAELELSRDGRTLVAGNSEVNAPLVWPGEGLCLYLTQTDTDDFGNPYAGIQIVKDPSLPFVYAGFGITICGFAWYFIIWLGKSRKIKKMPTLIKS